MAPNLRPSVVAAKERLKTGREKLRERHRAGTPGIQLSLGMADLIDSIVLDLFESAMNDLGWSEPEGLRREIALVAHGGYGRRDVAPFSDVDLMILHAPEAAYRVRPVAERLLRDVFDVGLVLGQSARTPAQASQLACKDAVIATSLIEARYLAGSVSLYSTFARRFESQTRRRMKTLLANIEAARSIERQQFGDTVYLLEPNVKRSQGGLRDIQLLRWIGFAAYGTPHYDELRRLGALESSEYEEIIRSLEFLLRVRNEMHFEGNKSYDMLDRREQVRLAEWAGVHGSEGMLPVEHFMREYFRRTHHVTDIVTRFARNARASRRWQKVVSFLLGHQVEGDFRVGPYSISATRRGREKLSGSLGEVLRLMDLANAYDKRIDHETREVIRAAVPNLPDDITPQIARRFMAFLAMPSRLGELLRLLHNLGVLERLVPEFKHARCLLQFNEYHKYTVDEHSILAVQRATEFEQDRGPVGHVYRKIKRRGILHLALLLHDLGKGYPGDHSDVGLEIAARTAARLQLSSDETELLKFLVHKHLLMSHLAFRRDTNDDDLINSFAHEVGSADVLRMLYVLTAADCAAVGPGVLNDWKVDLLTDLYRHTMDRFASEDSRSSDERLKRRREKVQEALPAESGDAAWYRRQIAELPVGYLRSAHPAQIADELQMLHGLKPGEVRAQARYQEASGAVEFIVGTFESIVPGVFHRLTGALSSQGLEILSAEINTLAEGLVLDRFYVNDVDHADAPPEDRLETICERLRRALTDPDDDAPVFRRVWRPGSSSTRLPSVLPTRVRTDNSTSDRYTILDIFAADRSGLLYAITRRLFELGLSVSFAKIGTYLDQVVDVFYVTDEHDRKIEDEARLQAIRDELLKSIEEFSTVGA